MKTITFTKSQDGKKVEIGSFDIAELNAKISEIQNKMIQGQNEQQMMLKELNKLLALRDIL